VKEAAEALSAPAAWKPLLPAGADTLARFIEDDATPLLVHPLGQLEIKQLRVPLETAIDRIGSNPVTSRRVHLDDPHFGTLNAQDVSHAKDFFAPGHFLNLSEDEQIARPHFEEFPCGIRMAAQGGVANGPAISVTHEWETVYPHEDFGWHSTPFAQLDLYSVAVLGNNAVSHAGRERTNPYLPPVPVPDPEPYLPYAPGRVVVTRQDDLSAVAGAAVWMSTTSAAELVSELAGTRGSLQLVTTGVLS
jgi:hypothetical protein